MEKHTDITFNAIRTLTRNTVEIWSKSRGIAPDSVSDKMDAAMFDWMLSLTDALNIWLNKGEAMTAGELILARVNLGSLVECWLRLFYCAYYPDYCKHPILTGKKRIKEPEKKPTFEELKNYSVGILWSGRYDPEYIWVSHIQDCRNAIHAFSYRDIGDPVSFIEDVDVYLTYIENISNRLPPLEDCLLGYLAEMQ